VSGSRLVGALAGLVLLLLGVVVGQHLDRSRVTQPAPSPGVSAPMPARLSANAYWVTSVDGDASRSGYAAWVVLAPGGNFVLESCKAPDYTVPRKAATSLPPPMMKCDEVIDGVITRLTDVELGVNATSGKSLTLAYSLKRDAAGERLVLDLGGPVALVPGSKQALAERLEGLPGDREARSRYLRRLFTGEP
jgi:hypothetical protein